MGDGRRFHDPRLAGDGGAIAGAGSPADGPPPRFPAQHRRAGDGERLPRDARGGVRRARRPTRGVPGPPRRVRRSPSPEARRPPPGEVPRPACGRRGGTAPRGFRVPAPIPADPFPRRPGGLLRRVPTDRRGDAAAAGRHRRLRGAGGPADRERGPRPSPAGEAGGARQRLLSPRPDGRGLHAQARRGAGSGSRDAVAPRPFPRRAAPAAREPAGRQRGDLRLLPLRRRGPLDGGPGRARPRDTSLVGAGLRSVGDVPGPRDRGRRHGTAGAERAESRADHRPNPAWREPGIHTAARRASAAAHVRLAPARALGDRRSEAPRGQCRPLPREDALVRAPRQDPRRDRRPPHPGAADRHAPRGASHLDRRPGRPGGGRAPLPDGRRLHLRLGVLETTRRLPRLRLAFLPAHDRARGSGVRAAARAPRRSDRGGGPPAMERPCRGGPDRHGRLAYRVPHPDRGRNVALDRPRVLASHRPGRDLPRPARLEPRRHREEALGGAAANRRRRDPAAARATRGRQHLSSRAGRARGGLRRDRRPQRRPALRPLPRRAGGAHVEHRPPPGRDRRRQGARRPRAAQPEPPPPPPARQAQLRGAAALARRERTVRSREGSLHRRRRPSERAASRSPTAAPSSSTRSASCPSSCRPSSCG